jgi:hypothetical protein
MGYVFGMKRKRCDVGLVSVDECKRVLGLDDREDGWTEWLIVSASAAIEGYCMRKLEYRQKDMPYPVRQACIELVAWNYKRFKDGNFEQGGLPENVRSLLEPWRRVLI